MHARQNGLKIKNIIRWIVLFYALCLPLLQPAPVLAHQAYGYQAVILKNEGLDFNWYPKQKEKVVIAIDKDLCQINIKGWQDFYASSVVLGINTDNNDFAYSLFAFTQGMGKEANQDATIALIRNLWDSNRLLVIDNANEYSPRETYPAIGHFPVEFMFYSRALAEKAAGRNLHIVIPQEGTLSLTKGEITKENLANATPAAVATQVKDPDQLNAYVGASTKTIRRNIIHIRRFTPADGYELLAAYLLLLLLIIFTFGFLQPKITRPALKSTLSYSEASLLLFCLVRIIKLEVSPINPTLLRYLWYAYYPCFFAISLTCLLVAYYTGTSIEEKKIPAWWQELCYLDILCTLLIFTNDLHSLFAVFSPNNAYNDYIYKAGILNIPIKLLVTLEFIAVPVILIKNNVKAKFSSSKMFLPLSILVLELVFHFCYTMNLWGAQNLETVFVTALGVTLFLLASAYSGLFPTNRGYNTAFTYSTASMIICDSSGKVVYDSVTKIPPDKNMRLHIKQLAAGKLLWQEDISEINRLQHSLALNNAALTRYNNLLQKKKLVRTNLVELELQEKMFKELETIISLKKEKMQSLVAILQNKALTAQAKEYYIQLLSCFVVFIKKRSVLLLSSQGNNQLLAKELRAALEESCSFYKKAGLNTACTCSIVSERLDAFDAMLIYDLAELVWEETAKTPGTDLLISVIEENGYLKIVIKAQDELHLALTRVMNILSSKEFFTKHSFFLTRNEGITILTMVRKKEAKS
jgi:hypothetical protein